MTIPNVACRKTPIRMDKGKPARCLPAPILPVRAPMYIHKSLFRHPPGPLNLNGATGLTWRHAYRMVFDPIGFMQQSANRYGDISFFRLFGKRGYLLNHPELIAQVLIHQSDAFQKLPRQRNVVQQILGNGILVSEGETWRHDRQHLQQAFGTALLERSAVSSVNLTQKMLDAWDNDVTQDMNWEMTRITAEIASQVLIGEDDPEIVDQLTHAVMVISDEFSHEMNSICTLPDWLPLPRKRRKTVALKFYRDLMERLIRKEKTDPSSEWNFIKFLLSSRPSTNTNPSFVSDQILTILIAAYHATSMALVWLFHVLSEHPTIESRVVQELATLGEAPLNRNHLQQLPYLKNVINETMRLYPPAWALFARISIKPVQMRGFEIEPGGWFYISPFVTHRTADFFTDPLVFDPERFTPQRKKEIPKHAFFPFGLGGRACIGQRMATEQLLLMAGTILRRFQLQKIVPGQPVELEGRLALRPKHPLKMKSRARVRRPGKEIAIENPKPAHGLSQAVCPFMADPENQPG